VAAALILAHQGGWDEAFLVGVPLIVFAGLLLLAKRRAEKQVGPRSEPGATSADSGPADES
jgi:hypothetical protein